MPTQSVLTCRMPPARIGRPPLTSSNARVRFELRSRLGLVDFAHDPLPRLWDQQGGIDAGPDWAGDEAWAMPS
jgi:hypothetical protein